MSAAILVGLAFIVVLMFAFERRRPAEVGYQLADLVFAVLGLLLGIWLCWLLYGLLMTSA